MYGKMKGMKDAAKGAKKPSKKDAMMELGIMKPAKGGKKMPPKKR